MLDGGPSRKSQTAERRAGIRLGSSRRHEDTAQPALEPQPVATTSTGHAPRPQTRYHDRPRSLNGWVIVLALFVVALVVGWAFWYTAQSSATVVPVEKDKYQAVFMSNGEILFGKLKTLDASHVELNEVFYIRSNTNDATATDSEEVQTEDNGDMQLIKRGEEVHGPEDAMIINRDQVLYYENLKPSSKVSQLIQKYMSGNR